MTKFERAYILLYNDRITLEEFADQAGIEDKAVAFETLRLYRERVLSGEIPDPRDTYNQWR